MEYLKKGKPLKNILQLRKNLVFEREAENKHAKPLWNVRYSEDLVPDISTNYTTRQLIIFKSAFHAQ